MNKQVLVTGAEGFIGSHLIEMLVKKNYKVRAFCLYNSFSDNGWLKDLDDKILKNVQIFYGDIRDFDSVYDSLKKTDIVLHLAALIAIPYSYTSPTSYVQTNIDGTLNVLRASRKHNLEQVIHISTSEVYGSAQYVPINESHPLVAQSPYAASKTSADQLAYSFYTSFDLPVSIARPFNTFGPRQSLRAIIPTIMSQIIRDEKKIHLGNTKTTRDFNYVKNTTKALCDFIGNKKTIGEVINIGSGVEISIEDLVTQIVKLSGKNIEVSKDSKRVRPEKSEVSRLCADTSKAKKILKTKFDYDFFQGITKTYDWFLKNKEYLTKLSSEYVK